MRWYRCRYKYNYRNILINLFKVLLNYCLLESWILPNVGSAITVSMTVAWAYTEFFFYLCRPQMLAKSPDWNCLHWINKKKKVPTLAFFYFCSLLNWTAYVSWLCCKELLGSNPKIDSTATGLSATEICTIFIPFTFV